jgi:hypothetical protein
MNHAGEFGVGEQRRSRECVTGYKIKDHAIQFFTDRTGISLRGLLQSNLTEIRYLHKVRYFPIRQMSEG